MSLLWMKFVMSVLLLVVMLFLAKEPGRHLKRPGRIAFALVIGSMTIGAIVDLRFLEQAPRPEVILRLLTAASLLTTLALLLRALWTTRARLTESR